MASNAKKPQRKTALNSSCLTGEPVPPGALVYLVKSYNPARGDQPVTLCPTRIHQRQSEHGAQSAYRGGSNAWSPEFAKYIGKIGAPDRRSLAAFQHQFWWTPRWAEAELYAHFPADVVQAVLLVRRDGVSWPAAAASTSVWSLKDLVRYDRQMAAYCRNQIAKYGV